MMKSVNAGEYAAPPAHCPAMIEICGTAPESATFWKNTLPYPDNESIPSWTRAPPESLKKMNGVPLSSAEAIVAATLTECISPAEPPATLKSWLATCTGRPRTEAAPVTTPSAGITAVSIPNNVVRCWASNPDSSKLSGSTISAIRSRAVSLPAACCFSWRFSPPPAMTSSRRVRSSRIRSCMVTGFVVTSLGVLLAVLAVVVMAVVVLAVVSCLVVVLGFVVVLGLVVFFGGVGFLDMAEVTLLGGLHGNGVLLAVDGDL